ncbi:hypothetical protein O181_017547, partial [Austropuccinia psidii MF-1]|nr:hypothetical protein [Austropuccinia psidii MF-1]
MRNFEDNCQKLPSRIINIKTSSVMALSFIHRCQLLELKSRSNPVFCLLSQAYLALPLGKPSQVGLQRRYCDPIFCKKTVIPGETNN